MDYYDITGLLGNESESLLNHHCIQIDKSWLELPGPDFFSRVFEPSGRSVQTLASLSRLYSSGRLAGSGYLSILPVDQGVEHTAAGSFYKEPAYFDPDSIIELAVEGGCNAVVTAVSILGASARKYIHKIPFIGKLNHNELLTYPNKYDQLMFASVRRAWNDGACGIGATIYFGSAASSRQIEMVSAAFTQAHELGMFTLLWCYLRNDHFKDKVDYHQSADLTGQANYLGACVGADIIKQKLPENFGGYRAINLLQPGFGKFDEKAEAVLCSAHPIDLCRYQVLNCFAGRVGLINSGGPSLGRDDLRAAVRSAVINKRAGGMGVIVGRKAFQRPMKSGIELLHAIQDVYLNREIDIA